MLLSKKLLLTVAPGLKRYDQDELLKAFNAVGVEVEEVIHYPHVDGLGFGLVKKITPHPTKPALKICQVDTGDEELQIECGAPNVAVNHTVVVAKIGTVLPRQTITAKEVGGITSYGMLCSYAEINPNGASYLSPQENHEIILLPPAIFQEHLDLDDVLGLNDTIFDLFIPTNRNDLNGVLLIANELKAALDSNFIFEDVALTGEQSLPIQITSNDVLSFNWCEFTLHHEYHETSWFWKRYLINSGIHVTNTIVDLANFISLLSANPVHFYDADRLTLTDVKVTNLDHEIEFTGLDQKQYMLQSGDLVVMAGGEIISLPGIMGGRDAMIRDHTKHIIVEIGTFRPQRIQATAKRLGLSTPSAERFSKALSGNLAGLTWLVSQNLILKEYAKDFQVLFTMSQWQQEFVDADVETINRILGTTMTELDIQEILGRTGFKYVRGRISVPSYRTDVHDAQDIAEEVMKSININDFKPQPVCAPALINDHHPDFAKIQELRTLLLDKQISEVKTYNLTSEADAKKFNWFGIHEWIEIQNPLSNQRAFFRGSLLPQMLAVLQENLRRKEKLQNIFEIQKIHYGQTSFDCLTIILSTDIFANPLDQSVVKNDFLLAHAIWELIADTYEVSYNVTAHPLPEAYPEHAVAIEVDGQKIGFVAQLSDHTVREYGLKNTSVLVINLDPILHGRHSPKPLAMVSELHPIFRDLTFVVPANFQIQPLIDDLERIWTTAALVDRFTRDGVTSYTIELKFTPAGKTPTGDEINAIYQEALRVLSEHGLALK